MGSVHALPGVQLQPEDQPPSLNLTEAELVEASGGYVRAADQLRELHARGFTRAYIPKVGRRRVVLERAHYDAVVRGQFRQQQEAPGGQPERAPLAPNRAGLRDLFKQKRKQ